MFIFISIWCSACDVGTRIYIPLCLYLYGATYVGTIHELGNLHSTMFIFICWINSQKESAKKFTFHYVYIYMGLDSPACFTRIKFTFHYVYIYIIAMLHIKRNDYSFTFHYVYIYIQSHHIHTLPSSIYIPLCLYLYKAFFAYYIEGKGIYIPLCLYLYATISRTTSAGSAFTFHYVYIYILHNFKLCRLFLIYIPLCLYLYLLTS